MAGIKSLAKDTVIYGLSSIIGRFLNWGLVPLYVYIFPAEEYGIVSYLYSLTAVALVVLNYGMETGYFRYSNREGADPHSVYTSTLASVGFTSILFIFLCTIFMGPLSKALLLPNHPWFVWMLAVTVAIDAFTNIPFAYLRNKNKAFRFAGIKLFNIFSNITLNLFFILACPWLEAHCPASIDWFYTTLGGESFGVGWIFLANLISTLLVLCCLIPFIPAKGWKVDFRLLRQILSYSWPLLVLGIAGTLSQNMGQILIPYLFKGDMEAARQMVGIYGANIKIAIVMVMFTQAFRYAYEPFIFARARKKGEDKRQEYSDAMKYFVLFGLFIFLGVVYFLPILKYFIAPSYWAGLRVVPIMMAAELCFGIYFNLSLWYKLTDRTRWGMYLSLICFVIMLGMNLWLVPAIGIPDGYMGSAWGALAAYFAVMVLSWALGRKYYPIDYHLGEMAAFTMMTVTLWGAGELLLFENRMWLTYLIRLVFLGVYLIALFRFAIPRK